MVDHGGANYRSPLMVLVGRPSEMPDGIGNETSIRLLVDDDRCLAVSGRERRISRSGVLNGRGLLQMIRMGCVLFRYLNIGRRGNGVVAPAMV